MIEALYIELEKFRWHTHRWMQIISMNHTLSVILFKHHLHIFVFMCCKQMSSLKGDNTCNFHLPFVFPFYLTAKFICSCVATRGKVIWFLLPHIPKHHILFLACNFLPCFTGPSLFMLSAALGNSPLEPFFTSYTWTRFTFTQVLINLSPAFQLNTCSLLSSTLLPTISIVKSKPKCSPDNLIFLIGYKSPHQLCPYSEYFIWQHWLYDLRV